MNGDSPCYTCRRAAKGHFSAGGMVTGVQGEGTRLSMDHGINLFCSGARRLNYDYNNRHIILTPVYAPFLLWIFFGRPRLMTPFKQTPVKFGLPFYMGSALR